MSTQPEPQPLPCPYPPDEPVIQDPGGFTDDTVPAAGGGGTRTGEEAIAWAQAQVARPTQDWERYCLMFVRMSYRVPVIIADAGRSWDRSARKHRTSDPMAVPRGVPVYWELPSVADHVALSLGDGWCISTDILRTGKVDRVRIDTITRAWGGTLLGWTEDLNGILIPREEAPPVVKPLPVHIADLSHHNKGITAASFVKAKAAGVQAVYHKVSEGSTAKYLDPTYTQRRKWATKAGLVWGGYHMPSPDGSDAEREADWFADHATLRPGDFAVLDAEDREGLSFPAFDDWCVAWGKRCRSRGLTKLVLYLPNTWALPKSEAYYDFVIRARYNDTNTPPVRAWDIWQFSNGILGKPDSIAGFGHVDLNTMRRGLKVSDLVIPAPPPPKRLPLNLRVEHASQQFSDTAQAFEASLSASLKRGLPLIGLTEVGKASRAAALRAMVAADGRYTLVWAEGGSAVLTRLPVLDKGVVPVLDAIPGPPSKGGRGPRGIAWVTVRAGQETVTYAVAHWPLGRHKGGAFEVAFDLMTAAMGKLAEAKGEGRSIFVWSGDVNLDDSEGTGGPAWVKFAAAGLVTCWDDAGKWPVTSDGRTIDVVGRYAPDVRARFVAASAQSEGTSDHQAVTATLRVKP